MTPPPIPRLATGFVTVVLAGAASAQSTLDPVVVTATRSEQQRFDAPAAIGSVSGAVVRDAGPGFHLSESLARIPGVGALDRQNWAQDLQLSIRGFGARATFGIRGVRLLVDGIPLTMPDGQGQAASVDLRSADRIEVLRGPLAQLYGNAAGGVVQVFTRRGVAPGELGAELGAGSFGTRRHALWAGGAPGGVAAAVDVSRLATDGWRSHSAGERRLLGASLAVAPAPGTRLSVMVNDFDQPLGLDPGGLTRAQAETDPRQAAPAALAQQARKTVAQRQAGVVLEHAPDPDRSVSLRAWGGERDLWQALSLAPAAQTAPGSAGGIVDLDRRYGGLALQVSQRAALAGGRLQATAGLEHERMAERRRGFINEGGRAGALRRDEDNSVSATDAYAQLAWSTAAWTLLAGLRTSEVRFAIDDDFVAPGNPDDSGRQRYRATNPVLGATWHATDALNVYANLGRGFETPTFAELAYREDGSGPNLSLRPSRSLHFELGAKWRASPMQRLEAALFAAETDDEIVVAANRGGRSTFRNAGGSTRRGVELAWIAQPSPEWRMQLAGTLLRAEFVDGFGSGADAVAAGNRIPGVPRSRLFAELAWRPEAVRGPHAALELLRSGSIAVDDRNSDAAAGYTVAALRAGWRHPIGPWRLEGRLRLENLADVRYSGSVIVNESQRRFFEPAPGIGWFAGVALTRGF